MEEANQTGMIRFHFRPFSRLPEVQVLIFVTFLGMYLVSVSGNLSIFLTIWMNRCLHTPMYFFLANLAALEVFYSSTIAPLTLASVLSTESTLISLPGCGTQMFFFIFLGSADCILLAVMAYDRFVAICHPLRYTLIMSWRACVQLAVGSLVLGFALALQLTVLIFRLPFCSSKEISLFYCDVLPVMRLACADTHVHEVTLFVVSVIVLTIPSLLITLSYVFIVAAVLKMRSAEGRHRAFSTCSSHLTVVLLQYGCTSVIYLCPSSRYSPDRGQVVSVVYTFVTPVLNPLIYSMRNRELKEALKRAMMRFLVL
ncbi:olfactory receptor 10V1 [Ictidomys tridecemlineatus]|uniref:olfactory receptor 10V1-like n=1 Tax=Ictidomys tridecemlineatus TaxID=43179 RepID=UPI00025DE0DC|nr:olfactory receptor 10V1-like [Ictidomys tridecemlineatus]KAG3284963.1 olfactory receptor 10V1-like [Ictidomys tridecemlineatus]